MRRCRHDRDRKRLFCFSPAAGEQRDVLRLTATSAISSSKIGMLRSEHSANLRARSGQAFRGPLSFLWTRLAGASLRRLKNRGHLPRDRKFESGSLQQTVWVSPRLGRYRSKSPRFRAGVHWPRSAETPKCCRSAQTGAVISVGRYSSTAVSLMQSGGIPGSFPGEAAAGRRSSKAEQHPLLVPG